AWIKAYASSQHKIRQAPFSEDNSKASPSKNASSAVRCLHIRLLKSLMCCAPKNFLRKKLDTSLRKVSAFLSQCVNSCALSDTQIAPLVYLSPMQSPISSHTSARCLM